MEEGSEVSRRTESKSILYNLSKKTDLEQILKKKIEKKCSNKYELNDNEWWIELWNGNRKMKVKKNQPQNSEFSPMITQESSIRAKYLFWFLIYRANHCFGSWFWRCIWRLFWALIPLKVQKRPEIRVKFTRQSTRGNSTKDDLIWGRSWRKGKRNKWRNWMVLMVEKREKKKKFCSVDDDEDWFRSWLDFSRIESDSFC